MGGKFESIDHIGIVVKSLDEIAELFRKISEIDKFETEEVPEQKVRVAMFKCGESNIEFLMPTSSESPIHKFLEKRGTSIHHIAFRVKNLEEKLEKLKKDGVKLIDLKPRIGANNKKIAFIHPKSTGGILIELCEKRREYE